MYQITAIYEGSEVAYYEGEEYQDTLWHVVTNVDHSIYAAVIDDIVFHVLKPNGRRATIQGKNV